MADGSKLYQQGATVEKFLEDSVDYLVALRTYPQVEFSEIEKPIRSNNFELFSYQDKYLENGGLEVLKENFLHNCRKILRRNYQYSKTLLV